MLSAQQVGVLLLKVSTFDNRRITPEMVQSWAEALKPYVTLDDAKQAVIDYYGDPKWEDSPRQAWILPGNVNKRVQRLRADRVDRLFAEAQMRVDGPRSWEAHRWLRAAIANGMPVEQAVTRAQEEASRIGIENRPKPEAAPRLSPRQQAFDKQLGNVLEGKKL